MKECLRVAKRGRSSLLVPHDRSHLQTITVRFSSEVVLNAMEDYEAIRRERIEANKKRMSEREFSFQISRHSDRLFLAAEVLRSKQEVQALGPVAKRADRPSSSSQTPKVGPQCLSCLDNHNPDADNTDLSCACSHVFTSNTLPLGPPDVSRAQRLNTRSLTHPRQSQTMRAPASTRGDS